MFQRSWGGQVNIRKNLTALGARIVCPDESLANPTFQGSVKKNCGCLPSCDDVEYQWQTSSMKWPTDEVMVGYTGGCVHVR